MRNKPRLLTPGPTALPERVRLAMTQDMIHHRKAPFKAIMTEVQQGLQSLFGTQEVVLPFAASGSGAMAAAVSGLFTPGEKLIVVNAGKFAERWQEIAECNGNTVVSITIPWGQAVRPEEIEQALNLHPDASGLLIQQSETSTGVQHPIKDIAAITRKTPTLLVVDGISGVSISPCPMEEWGIDCLLTGSQKGLMLPPGLALLSLSARGWHKAQETPVTNYYFNLCKEKDNVRKQQTQFTTPVSLIIGLQESLRMFAETGLSNIYQKQWALTQMVRTGVRAMGLELFAQEHYAWGVTSILLPEAVPSSRLLQHAAQKYDVIFAAGQDQLKDRMVRFGHMGWIDFGDILAGLVALRRSYEAVGGFVTCTSYLEQAEESYHKALTQAYPV